MALNDQFTGNNVEAVRAIRIRTRRCSFRARTRSGYTVLLSLIYIYGIYVCAMKFAQHGRSELYHSELQELHIHDAHVHRLKMHPLRCSSHSPGTGLSLDTLRSQHRDASKVPLISDERQRMRLLLRGELACVESAEISGPKQARFLDDICRLNLHNMLQFLASSASYTPSP